MRPENEKELTVRTFQAGETERAESMKWREEKIGRFIRIYSQFGRECSDRNI